MGFDPATAAIIVSTGAQVYGAYQGGQAAKKEAAYQKKINQNNQKIAKLQGQKIVESGMITARQLEADALRFADSQLLGFAGGGIDITSGAALKAVEETARTTAADIITLQHNIAQEVWGLEVGIQSSKVENQLLSIRARNAERASYIQIASILAQTGISRSQRTGSLPGGA